MSDETDVVERLDPARPLTNLEMAVLEFERIPWRYAGAKEGEILERFGMSGVRYHQVLRALLERPAAEAYDPSNVRRLRRITDRQKRARTTGFDSAH